MRLKIVVTGAAGFVGSVFTLRAVEEGHTVIAVDNKSRGLNPIWTVPEVQFVQHDCTEGLPLAAKGADAVVHLAAATGSLERPLDELRALNVGMTQRVFADSEGLFVYPTTSLALGVPDSPYVISKEEALTWLLQQGDRVLPLRFFNIAGSYKGFTERRRNEVHLLPTLVQRYKDKKTFVINGGDYDTEDGTPGRDFVHVLDAVDYTLFLMADPSWGVRDDDGAVWVGTGRVTTTLRAARIFEQFVGPLDIDWGRRRPYDVGELRCNKVQAYQMRQFRPQAPAWVAIRDEAYALMGGMS